MITYTKHTLQKLETLFEELDYTIRYEKGSFKSGYCMVENRKIAILNKFFETESRINTLIEILDNVIDVNPEKLTDPSKKLYNLITKSLKSEEQSN
jgi:hypothetical protein